MSDQLVDVATFGLVWEANLTKNRLKEEGIRSFLIGEHVFQTAPHVANPTGIRLQVAEGDVVRAKEVLAEKRTPEDEEH